MENKLFLITIVFIFSFFVINAGEIRNIEYSLNLTVTPYCVNNVCTNTTTNSTDNSTNITTFHNVSTCSSVCYGKITINGVDNNQLFFEIDTGDNKWKNATWELRYGYKSADLGNLSDISGIRQELQNLTATASYLSICNNNLTQCAVEKASVSTSLSTKDATINSQIEEIKDKKNERWLYGLFGIIAGILIIRVVYPAIQGRRHPQDPISKQFATSAEWK